MTRPSANQITSQLGISNGTPLPLPRAVSTIARKTRSSPKSVSCSITKLPFVRELCLKYERIDPVTELIPVRPVVHYMMGGVHTDIDGATPLAGLYAAGETACVSINGANRLGSNSLPECLVFGARAGRAAASYAASAGSAPAAVAAQASDEVRRLERLLGTPPGAEAVATIRTEMQTTMEDAAGIYRTGPDMAAGVDQLRDLQERSTGSGSGTPATASTPSWLPRSSSPTCSTWPSACSPRVFAGRSRAAPTSAPTFPHATTRGSSPTTLSGATRTGHPGSPNCR